MLMVALLLAAIRVTETAGVDRVNEPVTVDGRTYFVSVKANQSRTIQVEPGAPLRVERPDPVGFRVENGVLLADHSSRTVNGQLEDSGTLRALTFKPAGVTLLRTQNRMHWAPSFQRVGAKGYTSIAMWHPVQQPSLEVKDGVLTMTRAGHHSLYPEINLWAEYRYFAHLPYFLFHARMKITQAIDMFWLRAQEMTMDDLFTHVAWPGHLSTFEERGSKPLAVDVPWVAFLNIAKGYGFGAVSLKYRATTTANAHTSINDGANNGKYWDRHLVSRVNTRLHPGDEYEEESAYVLFRCTAGDPLKEFLMWEKRIRNPLRVESYPKRL